MKSLLARLLGGISPTGAALRTAHEAAERARLSAINRDPPPGNGWRLAPQDSEGKWTVWNGPRPVASFWDENEASEWARQMNRDPRPNPVDREDGKYCVNCGSHQTDESLKARGYVSCCPERYVIPERWHVTADRLATGHYHLWRPADGVDSIDTDASWPNRDDARHEADHRNLLEFRNVVLKPAALAGSPDAVDALAFGLTAAKIAADVDDYREPVGLVRYEHVPDPRTRHVGQLLDESGAGAGFGVEEPPRLGDRQFRSRIIPMGGQHTTGFAQTDEPRPAQATGEWSDMCGHGKWKRDGDAPPYCGECGVVAVSQAERRAAFLNVPIPDGVRAVVGPLTSPDDGNWWTFDRGGPVRGYTRRNNALAAAERANNAPQT